MYPRGQGKIRKRTKKNPWKGLSRSRRFSFHNFYNFFLFFFQDFTLSFFSILFLPTTFTHTHDPRPTTHDPRHLATLAFQTTIKSHCWSFKPRIWQLSHYALSIWHCQGCFPWLWLEIGCVTPSGKGPIYSLSSTRIKCVFYCVKYFWRWR